MRLAKEIVVRQDNPLGAAQVLDGEGEVRVGPRFSFTIDGEEFPFYIAEGGIEVVPPTRGSMPAVKITVLAERVEFVHELPGASP